MHSSTLAAAVTLCLMAPAAAQVTPQTLQATKVPGAVKNAGIYHVSTGTWTRTATATAGFGPDVIYSNTAPSGYFSSAGGSGGFAAGATNYDEGNVPGTDNTNNPGNRDLYNINCLQIGYCDMGGPGTGGWEIGFYESYAACEGASTPFSTTVLTGLPAAGGCWTMAIDLQGGVEICLQPDGGDGFDNDADLDTFGWSYRYAGTSGAEAGFLLAGDPQSTDPSWVFGGKPTDGTNTYFGVPSLCSPESASGLLTADQWYIEDPITPANDGCYWFGGYSNINGCGGPANPYASWSMEILADTTSGFCNCFCGYCLSNPNSTGVNSRILVTGSPSIAADNLTLTAFVPQNVFGFFITSKEPGFIANPAGSAGNICLGSNIGRFQQLAANSGTTGTITISTSAGQWSLSNIPQATGAYAAVVGEEAFFQCWHRDSSPAGPTSNFTDGIQVGWQP